MKVEEARETGARIVRYDARYSLFSATETRNEDVD